MLQPGRPAVSTGGLPQLLSTLQPEEARRADASDGGGVLGVLALLHVAAFVTLVAGALIASDASAFRSDALLVSGAVPTTFVALCVTTVCAQLGFAVLSALDAAYYLCTRVAITGAALCFGLVSTVFAGALAVVASLQLSETLYWLWVVATLCAGLALSLQLSTILAILVKNNAPLLKAIRQST
jgi:hypothetical protein